jgi:hypothetical protein
MQSVQVVEDTRQALSDVRRALAEVYASAGADPSEPQSVARQYRLNRNLTWKLSRVLRSDEPLSTLHHLPGASGVELAVKAFEDAGVDATATQLVRNAFARLQAVIEQHAGDREQLELMLESMGLFEREATNVSGRELAFRGNSSVWGLQCSSRMSLTLIGPSRTAPGKVDFAILSTIEQLQRLRPGVQWRLYRAQVHDDRGEIMSDATTVEPIEKPALKNGAASPLMIVPSLCSANMPALVSRPTADGVEVVLPGGEVGKSAAFSCSFGYVFRRLPAHADATNKFASTAVTNSIPAERVVFDVAVHRDVEFAGGPEIALFGFPHGGSESPALQTDDSRLPMREQLQALSALPRDMKLPFSANCDKAAEFLFDRMQWNPREFTLYRLLMHFPPLSSRLVMSWRLPEVQ